MRLIFITLIALTGIVYCQPDSIYQQLEYYPLQIGNYWIYKTNQSVFGVDPKINYYSIEVTGSKLQTNNKEYRIIVKQSFPSGSNSTIYYQRIDTLSGNIYQYNPNDSSTDYESVILKLFTEPWGTIICPGYRPAQIYEVQFLGINTIRQSFYKELGSMQSQSVSYIKKFGRDHYGSGGGYSYYSEELIYAMINGIDYGTTPNSINGVINSIASFQLNQNYPNPFNSVTILRYDIPKQFPVRLSIIDMQGREVQILVDQIQESGNYSISWDAAVLPSGVYFYSLKAGSFKDVKKCQLIK
ncbi:MAG: T9SS type A sorting domain-containing protein [bacterium]